MESFDRISHPQMRDMASRLRSLVRLRVRSRHVSCRVWTEVSLLYQCPGLLVSREVSHCTFAQLSPTSHRQNSTRSRTDKLCRKFSQEKYSVGIICALDVEKAAVEATLDEEHGRVEKALGDDNVYSFGKIGSHNVVVACLPAGVMGKASAAVVAKDMMRSFPIKVGLMVGICDGHTKQATAAAAERSAESEGTAPAQGK